MKNSKMIGVGLAVVLAIAGGVAVGADGAPSGTLSGSERGADANRATIERNASTPVTPNPEIAAAVRQFAVLREPKTLASALGDRAAKDANIAAQGEPFALHTVHRSAGYAFYVLCAARGGRAPADFEGAQPLARLEDVEGFLRGGLTYGPRDAETYRISGLFPDGTTGLTMYEADGTARNIPIEANFASIDVRHLPERASWVLADGSRQSLPFVDMRADAPAAPAAPTP